MAVAKKCDICGALYEHERDKKDPANGIALVHNYTNSNYYLCGMFDCCPDCMHSIQVTIELLKEKGERK